MDLILNNPIGYLDTLLLIFIRILGLMILVPFFSNANIPNLSKIIFSMFLSVIVLAAVGPEASVSSSEPVSYALAVTAEFLIGFSLGFVAYVVFSVISLAGQFIDMQIGFSMVNVFDPLSEIQLTITGNLYYYLLVIITLVTDAHYYFLRSLVNSFYLLPLGQLYMTEDFKDAAMGFMPQYFRMALGIAAPVFFVMLITNVVLGILARTVPQLNMFVVGFPIKILFGLSTILVMLAFFSSISNRLIGESQQQMRQMIEGMRFQ